MREAVRLLKQIRADRPGIPNANDSRSDGEQIGNWRSSILPLEGNLAKCLTGDLLEGLRIPLSPARRTVNRQNLCTSPKKDSDIDIKSGSRFIEGSYENSFGARKYRLYIPTSFRGQPLALTVMLHGCTQDAEDFAAGTRMNEIAEKNNAFVLYPSQSQSANISTCWNWFNACDQRRDHGEPSIIAGMTQEIVTSYHINESKVFVAGMSSGGAMAMILAATYPDLYLAAGIHSGLPYGAADNLSSALAAMRGGALNCGSLKILIPVIVFHGDHDRMVNPRNAAQILSQSLPTGVGPLTEEISMHQGALPGDRAYTRTVYRNVTGQPVAEYWIIQTGGHAWSGGSPLGSYTDPKGPDASAEMIRFFLNRKIEESYSGTP